MGGLPAAEVKYNVKQFKQMLDAYKEINDIQLKENLSEFLKEIIQDIIKLKIQNLSNPKSNEFSNRIRQIVGKSFNDSELQSLISET